MNARAARSAWALSGLTLTIVATTIVLCFVNRDSIHDLNQLPLIEVVLPIGFALVGGLVASRLPRNALGWLLLVISLANAIPGTTQQYTRLALVTHPGAPFTAWIPWLGTLTDSLVYPAGLAVLVILLIPDGRFLSPRWAAVAWVGLGVTSALLATTMFDPSLLSFEGIPPVINPTASAALASLGQGPLGWVTFLLGLGILATAGASLVLRLRRARGEERLQLRWVVYAVALSIFANIAATLVILFLLPRGADLLATLTTVIGFGVALPAAFAVAILRYRLYDLDLLLNRTVVYGSVTVLLAVAFGIADVAAQRIVVGLTNQRSDLIAGALGVGAALAFGPMRRSVRPVVDRLLPARSVLTLLFVDIVGSTQLIVELGDQRWRALLGRFRAAVRGELARFAGREVNTAGDAFFATFGRPTAGVDAAMAVRAAAKRLGIETRCGLHVGECEVRGEDVTGLAVHTAARVMAEAGNGEILLSEQLREAISDLDPRLQDRGPHELKGLPGTWRLYALQ